MQRKGMKRNLAVFFALLAAVIISITCSGYMIYGREFSSVEPHRVAMSPDEDGVRYARSYSELKSHVTALVRAAATQGTVQLRDYPSDIEDDLARACHEVIRDTPIGAYAVDMMTIDRTRVLNYWQVKVNITYKRSREEILAVERADSAEEFYDVMRRAIAERRQTVAIECNYYAEQIINIAETVYELRFVEPGAAYGLEDVTVEFFPKTGIHRMLLVKLEYYEDGATSHKKRADAEAAIDALYNQIKSMEKDARIERICRAIGEDVKVEDAAHPSDADTPYGALVKKRATDKGLASAVAQAVKRLGGYVVVVEGEYDGRLHYWNMVFARKGWTHVDLSRGVLFAEDNQMQGYSWDDARYPVQIKGAG